MTSIERRETERKGLGPNSVDQAADWAIELSPGPARELEREIANTRDPKLREVLLEKAAQNRAMAEQVGPLATAPQTPAPGGMVAHNYAGFTHYFPADATDAEVMRALNAWDKERSNQSAVRQAEKPMSPLQKQEMDERVFEQARRDQLKKKGGLFIRPAEEERKAVTEATGLRDPRETRNDAEAKEMVETGEYIGGNTTEYDIAKLVAGVGGYALAGPFGATAGEGLVRFLSVNANLQRAVKNGMDPEVANEIRRKELINGMGWDAAFNFGLPIIGQLIGKLPGAETAAKFISDEAAKVGKTVGKYVKLPGSSADDAAKLLEIKRAARANATDDPIRQKAATELQKEMGGDYVLTPSQVRGQGGAWEGLLSKTFPHSFKPQEEAAQAGADKMLRNATSPETALGREDVGDVVHELAKKTEDAVKKRLKPYFDNANEIGIKIDLGPTRQVVSKALYESRKVPGGALDPKEVEKLEKIFEDLRLMSKVDPEYALKFISRRKEQLRETTADWVPSKTFETTVNKMIATAENAYQKAADYAAPKVGHELLRARKEYGDMMETIFEDTVKQALRQKDHAKVADLFIQTGNVERVKQLNRLMRIAQREGVLGKAGAEKIRQDMARQFLQKNVLDIESAAKWSDMLRKPGMRDTWNALTKTPAGQELDTLMKVVEKAAQMSTFRDSSKAMMGAIALGRAANLGFGVSYVTGTVHGPMAVAGLTIAGIMKMATTAYTHGDKGTLNLLNKVVRLQSAGTGAAAKALQEVLPPLSEKAKEYGLNPFFSNEDNSQQPEE